jgi:PKD repeat protein
LYVDKLVLAIDPGYTPSGVGPPESPQSGGGGNPSPTASFTHTSTNLSVSFSDASTDDGTVASWSWDFGDGNASTEQNPTHAYGSAGTYTVSLTVTDDQGATGSQSQSVTVSAANQTPSASFTYAATNLSVSFSDGSTDDGTIANGSWDFGDGNASSEQNPTHAYGSAGTYTVSLTVTDDQGATGSQSQSVTVSAANQPPAADFTYVATDLSVQFEDLSTDDGTIASWSWDFGDGANSTEQNPAHEYAGGGDYLVTLLVSDTQGVTNSKSRSVSVSPGNQSPSAAFTFSATELSVSFSDTSTDDGTVASWSWDFGDGNASTEQNPTHAYGSAGT